MEQIKVGDIYAGTWGYSMTIPAFYIVTKVTKKRVKVCELEKEMVSSDGYGQRGYERPVEPYSIDLDEKEKICKLEEDGYLRIPQGYSSFVLASPWDGKPIYADHMD